LQHCPTDMNLRVKLDQLIPAIQSASHARTTQEDGANCRVCVSCLRASRHCGRTHRRVDPKLPFIATQTARL
jgi:nucleotidyltransferase/DNA polymerase involved in DNA repair